MTKTQMDERIKAEMTHIPKQPKAHQSKLRMFYPAIRKGDLGKNGDPCKGPVDAMREAVAEVRKAHPDAVLAYSRSYFGQD